MIDSTLKEVMTAEEVARAQQLQNELIIQARTRQEILINNLADQISRVDPSIFEGIEIPPDLSLKMLIPELYEEKADPIKYAQQFEECELFLNKINTVIYRLNKEAIECAREFHQIS